MSGPAAGLAVLVYEIIQAHGMAGLGVAVFLGGLAQMAAGWMRLGQWFRAISPAVIYGMLAGIGVLILAAQFHVMVDDLPRDSGWRNIIDMPGAVVRGLSGGTGHQSAALIGILTLIEDVHHVRVREAGGRARLLDEALLERLVVREVPVHDLHGDPALQTQVGGEVHGGHAAAGDA